MEPNEARQWVAYRVVPGAMLTAPLPSAPEVGDGWRGVDLRRAIPLDQLDRLAIETGMRSEAAVAVHVDDGFAYLIATAGDRDPVRLVLGVDIATAEGDVRDVLARAGATGSGARWRKQGTKGFEQWSSLAPRALEASAVLALMGPEHPPAEAVSWLAALLGIRVPNEPIPDPLDLQSVAREQLKDTPKANAKKRWFSRDR